MGGQSTSSQETPKGAAVIGQRLDKGKETKRQDSNDDNDNDSESRSGSKSSSCKQMESKNQDKDEGHEGSADDPGSFPHNVEVHKIEPQLVTGPIKPSKSEGKMQSGHCHTTSQKAHTAIVDEQG